MVEKHERPDHPSLRERQNAADFEPPEVSASLLNHQIDHRFTHSARQRQAS
jgi:hypothetical protein